MEVYNKSVILNEIKINETFSISSKEIKTFLPGIKNVFKSLKKKGFIPKGTYNQILDNNEKEYIIDWIGEHIEKNIYRMDNIENINYSFSLYCEIFPGGEDEFISFSLDLEYQTLEDIKNGVLYNFSVNIEDCSDDKTLSNFLNS